MREWYDVPGEAEATADGSAGEKRTAQAKQEQEARVQAQAEQRANLLNSLLERLQTRFPPLVLQFKAEIEDIETLDLLRRLSITLALARNEAAARRAILAVICTSPAESSHTDCASFLLDTHNL